MVYGRICARDVTKQFLSRNLKQDRIFVHNFHQFVLPFLGKSLFFYLLTEYPLRPNIGTSRDLTSLSIHLWCHHTPQRCLLPVPTMRVYCWESFSLPTQTHFLTIFPQTRFSLPYEWPSRSRLVFRLYLPEASLHLLVHRQNGRNLPHLFFQHKPSKPEVREGISLSWLLVDTAKMS